MPRKQSFNSARRYELFQLYVTPASIWVSHTESSKYLELCVVTNWVNFMPRIQSSKSPKPDHLNITHRAILKIMIQQITHTYTHNSDWPRDNDHILQHTGAHWSTLQHTATHCNTLQHTATHCNHTATHAILADLNYTHVHTQTKSWQTSVPWSSSRSMARPFWAALSIYPPTPLLPPTTWVKGGEGGLLSSGRG